MSTLNNQRVSARVNPEIYETITQAADLTGSTLNQFIVQSAYEKARDILEKEKLIRLTGRSAAEFFKALDRPPEPSLKLIKAVKLYKEADNGL